jgi:hypothetical protein
MPVAVKDIGVMMNSESVEREDAPDAGTTIPGARTEI